jgi:hypothetical protein
MNSQAIGDEAGKIWHYLHDHDKTKRKTLKTGQADSPDLVAMSIGWLARKGRWK